MLWDEDGPHRFNQWAGLLELQCVTNTFRLLILHDRNPACDDITAGDLNLTLHEF